MDWYSILRKMAKLHPVFKEPVTSLPLWKKVRNAILILIAYALLSEVTLPGINQQAVARFQYLELVFGSSMGTLMSVGISPVIMGALIVEILYAGNLLRLDFTNVEGKKKYMTYVMAMTIFMVFWESLTTAFYISERNLTVITINFILLSIGAYLALLMVEYLKRYSFIPAISLFVMYRVSKSIFVSLFNPVPMYGISGNIPSGKVAQLIHYMYGVFTNNNSIVNMYGDGVGPLIILPILGTLGIWLLIVYLHRVRIEIPSFVGKKQKFSMLMQTVMPIIFGAFTVQFTQMTLGFINSFINSPKIDYTIKLMSTPFGYLSWHDGLHWLIFTTVFAIPGILFGYIFTNRMTNEEMMDEFYDYVMSFDYPGRTKFRKGFVKRLPSFKMRIKLVNKYLALYSGIVVVLIALLGDALGVAAGGSGIILAVLITDNFKELFQNEIKKSGTYKSISELMKITLRNMFINSEK